MCIPEVILSEAKDRYPSKAGQKLWHESDPYIGLRFLRAGASSLRASG
jgi:hypothetical protein